MEDRITALEAENQRLKQQLMSSQGLITLGELVGTTTHEFNNILMTIINYAKLGLRHPDDPDLRQKAFTIIVEASEKAARITQSILGQARNRSAEMEPTDLRALTEDALLLLERELNKYRIQLETDYADIPKINAIGNQIQQVIFNLVINARQAMPDGGRVSIKIYPEMETNMVVWQIRDYGTGIPPEILPHIFEPFFSTKKGPDATGKGGSGVGLASCREIIQRHSGKIRVESTVGKGTAFTLRFPPVME